MNEADDLEIFRKMDTDKFMERDLRDTCKDARKTVG